MTDAAKINPSDFLAALEEPGASSAGARLDSKEVRDFRDEKGNTLLMIAIERSLIKAVRKLAPVSDCEAVSKENLTALTLAAYNGDARMVAALLPFCDANKQQAGNSLEGGATALMFSMLRLDEKYPDAFLALAKVSDMSLRNHLGETPLMIAAHFQNAFAVEKLLPLSNPDERDARGKTALMIAAESGARTALKRLLPVSDIEAQCHKGMTAMHYAAMLKLSYDLDVLRTLAPFANWSHQRKIDGATPFALALQHPTPLRLAAADFLAEKSPVEEVRAAVAKWGREDLPKAHARMESLELAAEMNVSSWRQGSSDASVDESESKNGVSGAKNPRQTKWL